MKPTISKSQYIKGLQCPKALWFYRFRKDLKPEIDAKTQTRFDTGNEISLLAQNYFHDGIEVSVDYWQINKCYMMVIDNTYVRSGEIDLQSLFKLEDISNQVLAKQKHVKIQVEKLLVTLDSDNEPIEKIGAFLSQLKYPLYYLDYETIGPAVPLFDGTKPYDQVSFQFSLHVQKEPGAELEIGGGGEASSKYHAFLAGKISSEEADSLFENLSRYCSLDTYAMTLLIEKLSETGR